MNKPVLKEFWELFKGYWVSEEKKGAIGLFVSVIALTLGMVYILVLLNAWYNEFYNALQEYNYDQFWPLIGKFTWLAFIYIMMAVYVVYLRQMLQIKWRRWMTRRYLGEWLKDGAYYKLQILGSGMDNPDQRIQEDISQFTALSLTLIPNFIKHLSILASFSVVLWNLSGTLEVPMGESTFYIPGYMLWFSALYSLGGTYFAHIVGRRLIDLNYEQQMREADFRFSMTRLRENSESVAFYKGEAAERAGFAERFKSLIQNFRALMQQTKLLNFYSTFYMQLAVIVPLILAAPKYFGGSMQLGGLMQTVSAFGRVQDGLSFFIEVYDSLAQLVAVTKRLSGFTGHLANAGAVSGAIERETGADGGMRLEDVSVELPDGRQLIAPFSLAMPVGKSLLITGASGAGKSTLLRTLSGLWPFGSGLMRLPKGARVMFLPQRPYLPLGTLKRAILYPEADENSVPEGKILAAMKIAEIDELAPRISEEDDWSRILSLGEQQRIAFARVLISRPDWLFLDESTSALDEERESRLYQAIREELPNTGIISVGHRGTLRAMHDKELAIRNGHAHLVEIEQQYQSYTN